MRRIVVALSLIGCAWFTSACSSSAAPAGPAPDMVIVNAKVYTVDPSFSTAEAVAITAGKFSAVGKTEDIRKLAGPSTQVIDAGGRTVIPGLMDNHLHNAGGGPGVDLSRARSLDDVLKAIGERVKTTDPGEVVVTNADWHEAQLKEQRLPYRKDLDTVAPNTAVVVVRGGHEYILNSAALKKWNITKATAQPAGGRISRDEKGELNGELVDRAKALVTLPPDGDRMNAEYFLAEHKKLNASGLTSIRYPGAPAAQYRILQQLQKEGKLTMRVNQLMRAQQAVTLDQMKEAIASWNVKQDEGDEWLRVGGVKMGVDGGFEGGWMTDLYEKPYDENGTYRGINTLKQEPYTEIVKELNRQGWRVSTHAVGDAAIDEVLAGYEAADAEKSIAGRRWTIEHGFIPRADQFPRMKKLDLAISAQNHLYLAGPSLVKMWGLKRASWVTPVRAYLEAGLPVSGGTDASVVPYPPLWVFYHFVTRDTITGGVLGEDQKISREEALKLLTINNAWLTFDEKTKGSIEVGKLADLVLLPEDLMTADAKKIEQMQVLMTVVGGKVVYQQDGFRPGAAATN
ncbi:MAG: amidohydrolase [Acidobacteria bacterium]|nr:amidohydrolase [Acidobacteriota bacterium]